MKLRSLLFSGAVALSLLAPVQAEPLNIDELLNLVKSGQAKDDKEFQQRMTRFQNSKAAQVRMLGEAKDERTRLENLSAKKEKEFGENETKISEAQERLTNRLGSLKEMFGVLQQVAGDTKSVFEGSVVSSEVAPDRQAFLTTLIKTAGSSSELPSMNDLERLWFEMQQE